MMLADLVLKGKVNLALVQDPRVGVLDIGVEVVDGRVTLTGDLDDVEQCDAAVEIARRVEGVESVESALTCGLGNAADTADLVVQRFMEELEDRWENLADQSAVSQAMHLHWALWLIYKFHLPARLPVEDREQIEGETKERALTALSTQMGIAKALLVLEMVRQTQAVPVLPPSPPAR